MQNIFDPYVFLAMVVGVGIGTFTAVAPQGIGTPLVYAMFLPVVVKWQPITGIALLIGSSAVSAICAAYLPILFGIPGGSGSQATVLDGYPMGRRGEARRALGASFMAGGMGCLIGTLTLIVAIPAAKSLIYLMGSPELFVVMLWGLSMISVLAGRKPLRGLIAAVVGRKNAEPGVLTAAGYYIAKVGGSTVEVFKGLKSSRVQGVLVLCVCLRVVLGLSPAAGQTNFYQGKTMTYVVNMTAGDSPDLWARAVARNMIKHIPGTPNIIVQNMPGGGSMIAANYIYNVAKPDGLTVGAVSANLYFRQLTKAQEVQFDWKKFTWIGSSSRLQSLLIMRADAPYKSIEEIRTASEPPKCSTTALGSTSHITIKMLEEGLGLKFRIVSGYKSGSDQDLAVERGEVQCRAVTTAAYLAREPFQTWQKKGFIRVLVQTPRKRNPKLPEVPTVLELMDRYHAPEANRRVVLVLLGADNFGNFPTVAPPGIPTDRVRILREAYTKALKEPDFLEEAKKRNWDIDQINGEELEVLAKEVIDQPPQVIDRIRDLFEGK